MDNTILLRMVLPNVEYPVNPVVLKLTPPSVLLLDKDGFENHLAQHRQEILHTSTALHQRISTTNLADSETQIALKAALAKNNTFLADIGRLAAEKDNRDDRLTDTMMRLLQLEKRLDRSKSATLAKIEAQATQRPIEELQEPEVQENGNVPSRPSSRVLPRLPSLTGQVNDKNIAELENTNATQRAALATVKEEYASVLREKSVLQEQVSQLTLKVSI